MYINYNIISNVWFRRFPSIMSLGINASTSRLVPVARGGDSLDYRADGWHSETRFG